MRLDCTVEEGYRELADDARELLDEGLAILRRDIMRFDEDNDDYPLPSQRALLERKKKVCKAVTRWMADLTRLKTRALIEK
ncbi:MAG TPA: hypothetical protein VNL17_14650 [Verrucomicrobiae bacterium]|nr:hypothetical protein [Verrucomicrobiae bacterium]